MKIRPFLIFLSLLLSLSYGYSQEELAVKGAKKKEKEKQKMPPKSDYLRIDVFRDTTALDTVLTFEKGLRHNVANRDLFAFLPFANPGRPMNKMTRELTAVSRPSLGVPMQHYMLYEKEQLSFYRNPTPITEFFFLTILNRGQNLDSNLAFNLSDQFNLSLGYRGFRSEGHYVGEEANSTSFRTTFNYTSKNSGYQLRGFMTTHNMNQLEPGALKFAAVQFESGNPQFLERRYVDQLLTNADSRVLQRAYYFDQRYKLVGALELTQSFHYDSRAYVFNQSAANVLFGPIIEGSAVSDKHAVSYSDVSAGLSFLGRSWGTLSAAIRQLSTRQSFDQLLASTQTLSELDISEGNLSGSGSAYTYSDTQLTGVYANKLGRVALNASVNLPLQSTLQGFALRAQASIGLGTGRSLSGWFDQTNQMPALNLLRYQSNYEAYRWDQFSDSSLENHTQLRIELADRRLGSLSVQLKTLNNGYFFHAPTDTYRTFGEDFLSLRPTRADQLITERAVVYTNAFTWRKLTLDLKGLYQQSDDGTGLYNIPKFIARSALFVSTDLFDKAMFAHIGMKARYFDTYYADGYHPVLGVFYSQRHTPVDGYAVIDAFFYAKVRTMDIFLTYEHLNAAWALPNYYAAPGVPFRDGVLRFGFTWNFFD